MKIKRIAHKFNSHQQAEDWNIEQYVRMTPEQRQDIAKELRRHAYGDKVQDVRQRKKRS
jgi:hypothetical protein